MAVPDFGPETLIQAITISAWNGEDFQEIQEAPPEAAADLPQDQQVVDSPILQVTDN